MDFAKLSIDELKKLRDTYRDDLTKLKNEFVIIESAMNKPENDKIDKIQTILEARYSNNSEQNNSAHDFNEDESQTQNVLREVTQIKSVDVTVKPVENSERFLYTCTGKFTNLNFEIEYESNLSLEVFSSKCSDEQLTKLNIKITKPMLQTKLQKAIEFYAQHPSYFSSAIVFLRSISDLIDTRGYVVKKLYEFEKNLTIGLSKNTDQHTIIFKSEYDNADFLHIKWNFKWDPRTGLARDVFTAKIVRADDQLMGDMKTLVEKLCSEKFALDSSREDKVKIFRDILLAVKDADTRNLLS